MSKSRVRSIWPWCPSKDCWEIGCFVSWASSSTGHSRPSKDEGPGASQSAVWWKSVCWSESFPSTGLLVRREEARQGPEGKWDSQDLSRLKRWWEKVGFFHIGSPQPFPQGKHLLHPYCCQLSCNCTTLRAKKRKDLQWNMEINKSTEGTWNHHESLTLNVVFLYCSS